MEQRLDGYLTDMCLHWTVGQVKRTVEGSQNARALLCASIIDNAIFELDMGAISNIVTRIDGTVPEEGRRDGYANLFGDALGAVLAMDDLRKKIQVLPEDPCIIGLAKAVVYISVQSCGTNPSKRRERQKAQEMVFARTGGRKTEPTKLAIETTYARPDWMNLPEGDSHGAGEPVRNGQQEDKVPE